MTDPLLLPAGSATLARLLEQVRRGARPLTLGGVSGTAAALFLYLIGRETGRRIVVLCPDDPGADRLASDLRSFAAMVAGEGTDPIPVVLFPSLGGDPYQGLAPHPSNGWERVEFLRRLRRAEAPAFFLLAGTSLLQPLPPPEILESSTLRVAEWQEISPERFQEGLVASGYAREDLVTQRGEWSRRGGILDVFPASGAHPLRIELFGNQVESLRTFDPTTQRSLSRLESAEIPPIRERPLTRECMAGLIPVLEKADPHAGRAGIESRAEALRERGYFMGVEALAGLAFPAKASLFDYLAPGDLLAVVEPGAVEGSLETAWADLNRRYREDAAPALPPPERLYLAPEATRTRFRDRDLSLEALPEPEAADLVPIQVRSRPAAGMPGLLGRIREDLREGWWQVLALETAGRLRRMGEILAEEGLPTGAVVGAGGGIFLRLGTLREGFELPESRLALYTEAGIFGEARRAAPAPRAGAAFHPDFRDLRPGDLLVHAEHGIGRFLGLERITAEGRDGDEFLILEYLDRDRLYLPIFRLDLVQRYSGSGGTVPRLDRLGGRTWERTQARVRRAMREMAEELLRLYAARKAEPGLAFSRDTPWQQELEDAFPFEATPDQARAIGEVKQDMERPAPMDRLLCGDVGFGKTEVALRSAFKAVMDGRQVAVLVPTTVLAYQHFRTFRDRFAPFPVRVDLLSRFRTPAEQKRTLADLAEGKLDVVIGTHRILSGDVRFRNLGLLIIDEEQRFGVRHKERIQAMRRQVDVLTMTATPIPRTLQMSLAGIRDLSLIETPPRDRLEIQTTVVPFREGVLSAAIRAELARGGQIYFVHNRVESIGSMARLLLRICPEARLEIAHGQMREAALEKTMLAFMEGKFDVLLSTTIIENGLDIPNVNTLIVN
ncbi:MAG: DEAD/DEAH box helicase, partial [Acidobacteria bacterium]|nr:DEAD/DEAH box helicase [Acidobacteriota bacterium]